MVKGLPDFTPPQAKEIWEYPTRTLTSLSALFLFESYAAGWLAPGATYTPTAKGIFTLGSDSDLRQGGVHFELYHSAAGAWHDCLFATDAMYAGFNINVGGGSNLRVHNGHGSVTLRFILMRMGVS